MTDDSAGATGDPAVAAEPADQQAKVEEAQSTMLAIWSRALPGVLGNVSELEDAIAALLEERLDDDARARAERSAHKIAGSAGTFGFHRASELARLLETLFAAGRTVAAEAGVRAAEQVEALRRELDTPFSTTPARTSDGGIRLLVVRHEDELTDRIRAAAVERGLRHCSADDLASARTAIQTAPPDVVLLDLSGCGRDGPILLSEIASISDAPVLVLTAGEGFIDRVEAVRAGATAFLSVTLAPGRIVDAVVATSRRNRAQAGRLLAVDDDPAILAALEGLFHGHPLQLTTLSEPLRFWEVLDEAAPDLVLLDLDMPTVGGLDLCRLIRADSRWETLPVLVLTGNSTADVIHEVFAAGADDYVRKPIVGPELRTRVVNRLERVRLYRQLAETDSLTGLANRRKFESEVRRLRIMAARYHQPLSFALLDVDGFKRVNDQHGHATGDAVLQRLAQLLSGIFRAEDVVARWGGEEIALAMYGMKREDGVARVAAALETFREIAFPTADGPSLHVTFSAGVAQFDVDGQDLHELYRRADEVLYAAKSIGGDRALPVGWSPTAEDGLMDVVIVEDDPTLASLLTHALETRGYRSVALSDGKEAVRRLTGPSRLRARVIMLDVDLPGMSGLDVLHQLGQTGVLGRSKVIMLTARSGEPEVLAALREGAFDHVAKPFSVPVLMQRVRTALAT